MKKTMQTALTAAAFAAALGGTAAFRQTAKPALPERTDAVQAVLRHMQEQPEAVTTTVTTGTTRIGGKWGGLTDISLNTDMLSDLTHRTTTHAEPLYGPPAVPRAETTHTETTDEAAE